MKRYYVCKIIGDGLDAETSFRPAIADIVNPKTGLPAFSYSTVIENDENGFPTKDWCLVIASGEDHSLIDGIKGIDALPDYALDAKVAEMDATVKTESFTKLDVLGIDVSTLSAADEYRHVIRSLGKQQDAAFHEDAFDVADD